MASILTLISSASRPKASPPAKEAGWVPALVQVPQNLRRDCHQGWEQTMQAAREPLEKTAARRPAAVEPSSAEGRIAEHHTASVRNPEAADTASPVAADTASADIPEELPIAVAARGTDTPEEASADTASFEDAASSAVEALLQRPLLRREPSVHPFRFVDSECSDQRSPSGLRQHQRDAARSAPTRRTTHPRRADHRQVLRLAILIAEP